jgi:hypothetical protein
MGGSQVKNNAFLEVGKPLLHSLKTKNGTFFGAASASAVYRIAIPLASKKNSAPYSRNGVFRFVRRLDYLPKIFGGRVVSPLALGYFG